MRFFVSCFGGAGEPTAARKPVVPPPSRNLRRNKTHWRPALGSISEETAPPLRERDAAAEAAGDVKRIVNSNTAKAQRRHYGEDCDYSRVVMNAIMPTFSPTPFMF
ncbi:unnamed protein product [Sphenostylis stenocarpa]|uniref:Uncharacterized protein n=1 Tax=Sphenostylis stenocarpa TaxID=92480 RepID=A0AA86VLL8_9FABA|nr:unnamed protein product [Sphenostylis stenocarpa]